MKRTLIVLGIVVVLLLAYGVLFLEPAEAGCGGSSGCGMSHATQQQSAAPAAKAGQYTCPMHPEIVSDTPGKCPKCGMNLEMVQGAAGNQSEMTGDMATQCQQMVDEFATLQDHFDMMMKLTDVEDLGPAMVKHQTMMAQLAVDLAEHQEACRQIAGVTDNQNSAGTEHSTHGH
jgi:hypothetical protein